MRALQGIAFLIRRLARALTTGWLQGLRALLAMLRALLERKRLLRERDARRRKMTDRRCVDVRHPALSRPDPLIYSQSFLLGLGLAVTWDNPDIQLSLNGVPVPSSGLQPGTTYGLTARVWNGSTEAPVVGMPVRFTVHGFGIGTAGALIDETTVDLGVKGGPGHPAFATVQWTTPTTPGHYCLQAHLDWFDDANPLNNVGQENTDVVAAQSPARTTMLLRNDARERRRFRFEADSYEIPHRRPCRDVDREPDRKRRARRMLMNQPLTEREIAPEVAAIHDRGRHPLPEGWQIAFDPATPVLAPDEEQTIAVEVTPPAGFSGRQAVNVDAFDDRGAAGGVTFWVEVS